MAIDVAKKINKRRKGEGVEQSLDYSSLLEYHQKERLFLEEIDAMALWMSKAVIAMLSDMLDDIQISDDVLRSSFHRSFRRMLNQLVTRSEKVVFFHEAIPGFTALTVRKGVWSDSISPPSAKSKKSSKTSKQNQKDQPSTLGTAEEEKERQVAIQSIVGAYIARTGNRVISIDGLDVTLVLFPVEDLKNNLHEMGFWGD